MDDGERLFSREAGRLVAALARIFGMHNLALAEDVVQDVFCRALEVWKIRGVPRNPSAWLMTAAKNRAVDVLRRERRLRSFAPDLDGLFDSEWTLVPAVTDVLASAVIEDDALRMMFSCCHPEIPENTQVALVLQLVCGLGVREIAAAFLTKREAMEKRLARAKKTLAATIALFDLSDQDFAARLQAVQRAIYLLFNEGYHGASPDGAIHADLCGEALRLAAALRGNDLTATPATLALGALLYLHASRLPARTAGDGSLVPLAKQDRSRWNLLSIDKGVRLLERAATGGAVSEYHLEAAIAGAHARTALGEPTNWATIVTLYDALFALRPSPVVALSRAIAVGELEGPERALEELRAIDGAERLLSYPFYPAAMGEFELRRGAMSAALAHFATALTRARNAQERDFFERRIAACRTMDDDDRPPAVVLTESLQPAEPIPALLRE